MEGLITQRDTTSLLQWLTSNDLEKQAYAVEALRSLEGNATVSLRQQVADLIKEIESSPNLVKTCIGYLLEMKPLREAYVIICSESIDALNPN